MLQWITLLSDCCSCFFRIDAGEWGCSVKRQECILLLLIAKFFSRRVYQTAFPLAQLVSHFHNMEIFFPCVSHLLTSLQNSFQSFSPSNFDLWQDTLSCLTSGICNRQPASGEYCVNIYRMWNTCHPNPVLALVSPKSVPGQALDQTETQGAQWLPPLRDRHSLAAIVHPV